MYITIDKRRIGPSYTTYFVAEMSANHNQNFDTAVKIIEAAKKAGADAIKLQTYTPETLTIDSENDLFRVKGTIWEGKTLYDLYQEGQTPWPWHSRLKEVADALDLDFLSTPFDSSAVDFLEQVGVEAYKVASFEIVDLPLLRRIASTRKPIILSTGMATFAEIDEAVRTIREVGGTKIALLKCTSAYPAPPEEMNLRTIPHMKEGFGVPVGLSDHTPGISVAVVAVALGASIVEKHLTLSRDLAGPDSAFSLEPHEFKAMVEAVRMAEKSLGEIYYGPSDGESGSRVFRRSLFVVRDMKSGEPFTVDNVRSIRPGYGLHTRYLERVIGRHAREDIKRGTPLDWDLIAG